MRFELRKSLRGQSNEVLLENLRQCAADLGKNSITKAEYTLLGTGSPETYCKRFGSWEEALKRAGLEISKYYKRGITEEDLLENIRTLWIELGRQPSYQEVKLPLSKFSTFLYEKRFGSWSKSLDVFIDWVNADVSDPAAPVADTGKTEPLVSRSNRRTRREINDRQRFRILVGDGFRCRKCGRTPLKEVGVELHVDHILPWSKGGETIDENLETKCAKCNLGKGNAFNV